MGRAVYGLGYLGDATDDGSILDSIVSGVSNLFGTTLEKNPTDPGTDNPSGDDPGIDLGPVTPSPITYGSATGGSSIILSLPSAGKAPVASSSSSAMKPILIATGVAAVIVGGAWLVSRKRKRGRR